MHDGLSYRMLSVVIIYTGIQARNSVTLLAAFVCLFWSVAVFSWCVIIIIIICIW
jgi:hypothetical protein